VDREAGAAAGGIWSLATTFAGALLLAFINEVVGADHTSEFGLGGR